MNAICVVVSRCVNVRSHYSSNGHFLWPQTIQYGAGGGAEKIKKNNEKIVEELNIVVNADADAHIILSVHFAMKQQDMRGSEFNQFI